MHGIGEGESGLNAYQGHSVDTGSYSNSNLNRPRRLDTATETPCNLMQNGSRIIAFIIAPTLARSEYSLLIRL